MTNRRDTDRLARLLGPARARVLRGLTHPAATTTGLAAVLGYAPSSVSAQLSILVESGVATRRRAGHRVVYGLTPAGRVLLACLDGPGLDGPG
ncbi:ArsR/SmtB family transcription factor [Actinoplanes sp. NPDC049265]|uniref:ArsR/SmtB family transcription factor n=1 Tax=Actinoplanes sp. NPDC049265 TaxID=3363902 RepID=UPI0037190A1A